ncbi:GAF and ANTAR domain-containing protein [Microbacterium sp. zg.B48]|uniref:GAF and ANTAR domain-containing protein n=1 Tax=unclassified Microbacterium TaxID=2609290 RepID=UPI00214AE480|nr:MULTISPECIES: GAF and ANTAR domain-containing protein [unclassified Microbacterium]MCR2763887.1 GAF and ANTAR domain-containing protein [Microbacterium sp. zg.B48]MCR2810309.1 GAF and ANTAR domain-containing protein [Microbacterium sp. zg.B185]WIM18370.1 GAF and ANTAR domain-containing protein [Microbacterium sp. zg-B185]
MAKKSRDARLSAAFVKLADTLVDDYDVVDLLDTLVQQCTLLVDSEAGGLLIADTDGWLQLIASTNEEAEFVEIIQLNAGEGPCVEAYTTGKGVTIADISQEDRWSAFCDAATRHGFQSMHAFPLRLRGQTIGAMGLFSVATGELSEPDLAIAQALADVATIGILQERSLRDSTLVAEQLQRALDSRVIIEQAKGVIAAQTGADMHASFTILRDYARHNQLKLSVVAEQVAERTLNLPTSSRVATE